MAKYLILQYPGHWSRLIYERVIFTIINNKCKLQMIDLVFAVDEFCVDCLSIKTMNRRISKCK